MFNKRNLNENNSVNFDCSEKLKNNRNSNEEFDSPYLIVDPFIIKNGLLGINRTAFLNLLKCFKKKDKNKIRTVYCCYS
jgi:hypothetical protein